MHSKKITVRFASAVSAAVIGFTSTAISFLIVLYMLHMAALHGASSSASILCLRALALARITRTL